MGDAPKMCSLCKHVEMYWRAPARAATWFCTNEVVGSNKHICPTHYCSHFEMNDADPWEEGETVDPC